MSTEVPQPPKSDPPVDPDNFHNDSTEQPAPEGLLTPKKPTVKPDNFHNDGVTK
ncbi:hypothetical protein [Actinacidiphila alni]|uniref:Uncharacterized protein n=1 Tax=Actinacidiphila alni TaxID=380248 RepID=A0A1I2G722_9ACTN|nr:hypothetical protein [Actinacidiphila alni]SFF12949.1 hypothetical protein SAMN05216251_108293 [Actinacidiphila alni]